MKRQIILLRIKLNALSRIFSVNLGSHVLYRGKEYVVCNGVRCGSWRIEPVSETDEMLPYDGWVKRNECRKILSWKNCKQTYNYFVRFWKENWLDIWMMKGKKCRFF